MPAEPAAEPPTSDEGMSDAGDETA
jgi:hypothetical protein